MDAVEYLKEMKKMCNIYNSENFNFSCNECPLYKSMTEINFENGCFEYTQKYPEKAIEINEKWSKDHPIKTNSDKFKEVFGEDIAKGIAFTKIPKNCHGFDCPKDKTTCQECLYYDFWNREYKEPERKDK